VLVQAIAAGRFSSLSDARHYVAAHSDRAEVLPRPTVDWREAAARYADIEGHFDRR